MEQVKYYNSRFNEDTKYFDEVYKLKVKCKCGHTQTVFKDKTICDWCGSWIFRDKKDEFKYRMLEKIRRV